MNEALIKFARLSPTKARLIARETQGINAELVTTSSRLIPDKGVKYIANTVSNAVVDRDSEANEVVVKSRRISASAVLKRFCSCARGSVSRTRESTLHIIVEIAKFEVKKEGKKTLAKAVKKATGTKKVAVEKKS